MDQNLRRKIAFVFIIFLIGLAGVITRLAFININDGERLRQIVADEKVYKKVYPYERGMILDRTGSKLAFSITLYKVTIDKIDEIPKLDFDELITHLSDVLDISEEEIREKQRGDKIVVTKKATNNQQKLIDKKFYNYLWIDPVNVRHYPNDSLAADVIGRTSVDDETLRFEGIYGVEKSYNEAMIGRDGWVETQSDKSHRELVYNERVDIPAENGADVYLTIDAVIQHYVEQALEASFIEYQPKAAHAMIMDVNTGEILAMGSYPTFNPVDMSLVGMPEERMENLTQEEKNTATMSVWNNDLVQSVYELGSTLKLVTAAVALEESVATPDTVFDEGNNIQVADRNIKCWYYPRSHGKETLTEAVGNSCNPVFVRLGQMIGKEKFYEYYTEFGLKEPTGIDLPTEAYPLTFAYNNVGETELATMTFGHGVSQSPIQVATAIAAIVNGGYLLEPHIVKQVVEHDGEVSYQAERTVKRQVISEITSQQMRNIMEYVVTDASGTAVQIPGYRIGGKTGTSEKVVDGEYSAEKAIASFVAVAPINDPQILVYVVVDEPQDEIYGSKVAGPLTRNILVDTLDYLEIEKDMNVGIEYYEVPDVIGMNLELAKEAITEAGMEVKVVTDRTYDDTDIIINQYPKGGSLREKGSLILLELNE